MAISVVEIGPLATEHDSGAQSLGAITVTVPSSREEGDLLLIDFTADDNDTFPGFIQIFSRSGGTPNNRKEVFWKISDGTETTVTSDSVDDLATGMARCWVIRETSSPLIAGEFSSEAIDDTLTYVANGIIATKDSLLIALFSTRDNSTFSTPSGWTERYDDFRDLGVPLLTHAAFTKVAASGLTGNITSTKQAGSAFLGGVAALVEIRLIPEGRWGAIHI